MRNIADVKIEKGDEHHPTLLRIQFYPMPWNFAFYQGKMERWFAPPEVLEKHEVRKAVESCVNLIHRELIQACEEQLGVKW